jgi:membrane protease subunit HflC
MNKLKLIGVLAALVAVIASMSLFTVNEREKALLFQLGKIKRADFPPGLHFKIPFINEVRKFDARLLTMDAEPERFLTVEKKNVIVDSFVKWRIRDAAAFYKSTGGDERRAELRLAQVIKDGLRGEISKRTIKEVISGERAQIMESMRIAANVKAQEFGMEVIDVRVKRIDLPAEVSDSVYRRMEKERATVAKAFRSRGEEQAKIIRAEARKRVDIMLAEADRDSERIRGEGDAKAAEIYAQAYNKDPEFYAFYRSLNAYKNTFKDRSDLLVIEPDSDFFQYFKKIGGGS